MTNKKMKISDNIRILRENFNYSQEQVADKLGLSQQAYSLIEKNPEKTSLKYLQKIADVFSVSVSELIMEDERFVQQNFNQKNCNIASKQQISSNEGYEKLIDKLETEIIYLKEMIQNSGAS